MPDRNFDTGHFDWTVGDLTLVAGTLTSGDRRDTYEDDGSPLVITEVAADPGYDLHLAFLGVRALATHPAEKLVIDFKGFNDGSSAGHNTKFQLWNFDTGVFDDVTADPTDLDDSETDNEVLQLVVDAESYCSGDRHAGLSDFQSTVVLRIYHDDTGNVGHTLEIEKISVTFAPAPFA